MSTDLTIRDQGRVVEHTQMSDTAFIQAISAGWRQGEAVLFVESGYYFLIEEMTPPTWDMTGQQVLKPGRMTVERHRFH